MSPNRLASLKHRQAQFERQLTTELSNRNPDEEAMAFFKSQKHRINDLIRDIEGKTFGGTGMRASDNEDHAEIGRRASM